jgi:hypothetical protein
MYTNKQVVAKGLPWMNLPLSVQKTPTKQILKMAAFLFSRGRTLVKIGCVNFFQMSRRFLDGRRHIPFFLPVDAHLGEGRQVPTIAVKIKNLFSLNRAVQL